MIPRTASIALIFAGMLAVAGWYVFLSGGASTPVTALSAGAADAGQSELLKVADQLDSLSFNTRILADPRFAPLDDITVPVVPEASGRPDPFAPFPGAAATQR